MNAFLKDEKTLDYTKTEKKILGLLCLTSLSAEVLLFIAEITS